MPQKLCAECYGQAVINFSREMGKSTTLKEIHFIDKDQVMVQEIKKAFQNLFY